MTNNWEKLKDIFAKASEMEAIRRKEYLDEVCQDDPNLREEIESLLASFEESESFIEEPVAKISEGILGDKRIAQNFGNYKIVKKLGYGGMGVVYLATREDKQFRQRVALKIVKRGLDTEEVLRRFRNERQILASLHHPNIAQLVDGGTTDDGLPFFAMEYIEGLPLLQFCNEQNLSTDGRLDLFKKICSAVQHAHQNLVIHRDLKPNNIIVNSEGEPKLLDFGIAKFLNPELMGDSINQTQTQFRVMTPEYASPEQIKGQHITTASDIYSLGVILYELLTGEKPFQLEGKSLEEVFKTVTQSEAVAPSSIISQKYSTITEKPKSKVQNPKLFKGDLDNIVLMALRKEPTRRYKSVEQFSEDIQRHLKGLPVIARPNTFSYRAEKFIKRNLAASIIGALLVLSLLVGLFISLRQTLIARKESIKAQKINAFLQKTFTEAPFEEKGQNLKFAEVLETASSRAETELADEPAVKAQVLATLGQTYYRIGLMDKAEEKTKAALELAKQVYGEMSSETAQVLYLIGTPVLIKGKLDEAEQLFSQVVEIEKRNFPQGSLLTGQALLQLAEINVRKAKLNEATQIAQEAIVFNKKFAGENSEETAESFTVLGRAKERLGNLEEAAKNYRSALDIYRQSPKFRFVYGSTLLGLGSALAKLGNFAEAEKVLLESQTIFKDTQGANSLPLAEMQNYLMIMYFLKGNYQKVESIGTETRKMFVENGGKDTNGYFSVLDYLGVSLAKNGKPTEGEAILRESLEKRTKTAILSDWRIFNTKSLLAVSLIEQNKFDEAEKFLLESKDFFTKTYGENDYRTIETKKYIALLIEKKRQAKII